MHFGYGKDIYNNNTHSFGYWMMDSTSDMAAVRNGIALRARLLSSDTDTILPAARVRCAAGHGMIQTYSPKVFIPLTTLCRNVCHYCTFAHPPRKGECGYLRPDEVLAIAEEGKRADCREALFTLGDKPELRYAAARKELAELGYGTTLDYLETMCALVLQRTGLLPHVNAGVMAQGDLARLRGVSASQGLMLEAVAFRLCEKGGIHPSYTGETYLELLETVRNAVPSLHVHAFRRSK